MSRLHFHILSSLCKCVVWIMFQQKMPEGGLLVFKLSPYKTSKSPSQPGGGGPPLCRWASLDCKKVLLSLCSSVLLLLCVSSYCYCYYRNCPYYYIIIVTVSTVPNCYYYRNCIYYYIATIIMCITILLLYCRWSPKVYSLFTGIIIIICIIILLLYCRWSPKVLFMLSLYCYYIVVTIIRRYYIIAVCYMRNHIVVYYIIATISSQLLCVGGPRRSSAQCRLIYMFVLLQR